MTLAILLLQREKRLTKAHLTRTQIKRKLVHAAHGAPTVGLGSWNAKPDFRTSNQRCSSVGKTPGVSYSALKDGGCRQHLHKYKKRCLSMVRVSPELSELPG